MSFLHTSLALAGLGAIAIPIIIHLLLRQRRRVVKWGAMKFLIEAYRKMQRRIRLEQWLLLAVRCLLVVLAGAALARPLISGHMLPVRSSSRLVYLVIDNGLASTVVDGSGDRAVDRHVRSAREIVEALEPADRVGIVTLGAPVKALLDPPSADHATAQRLLDELEPVQTATQIDDGLARVAESIHAMSDDPRPVYVYLLSDFLSGSANLKQAPGSRLTIEGRDVRLFASRPATGSVVNVQIADLQSWRGLVIPGQTDLGGQFTVKLRRVGDVRDEAQTSVRLDAAGLNRTVTATQRVSWSRGQSEADVDLQLDLGDADPGEIVVTARIDQDALRADDSRFALLEVKDALRVALVDRHEFGDVGRIDEFAAGTWIRRALEPGADSPMSVTTVDPGAIDRGSLRGMTAVIITRPDLIPDAGWDVVGEFVQSGGFAWIMPAQDAGVAVWGDRAAQALGIDWRWAREVVTLDESGAGLGVDPQAPQGRYTALLRGELEDLTAPINVWRYLPIEEGLDQGQAVLNLLDGTTWLAGSEVGAGRVVYLGSAPHLSWTSLPAKPLMIALVHEVIRQGAGAGVVHRWATCGDRIDGALPRGAERLQSEDGRGDGIDQADGVFIGSGVYVAKDSAERNVGRVVVNIDPEAGRTEAAGEVAVGQWLGTTGSWNWMDENNASATLVTGATFGEIGFWVLCGVGALVLIEAWLARRFSHAYRRLYEGDGGKMRGGAGGAIVSTLASSMGAEEKSAAIGAAR